MDTCDRCGGKGGRPSKTFDGSPINECGPCKNKIADMNRNRSFPKSGVEAFAMRLPTQDAVDARAADENRKARENTRAAMEAGQEPFIPVPDRGSHPKRNVDPRN